MSAFGGIADINPQRTAHNSAFPYIDPPTVIPLIKQVRCGALCAVVRRPAIWDRWMIIQPQMVICEGLKLHPLRIMLRPLIVVCGEAGNIHAVVVRC